MSAPPRGTVAVVGAGIGGLALAAALRGRGVGVTVLERAPALGDVGAGVQISPNGMAVLRGLGLGEAVAARGLRSRFVVLRDGASGREVIRMPQTGAFHMLRRPDLVGILSAAAAPVECSREVVSWDGSALTLADGRRIEADFIVGADGVRSRLRRVLNGSDAARFTGQVAWRAIVEGEMAAEAHVFLAPGRHLVAYPVGPGAINLVGVEERRAWQGEGWRQAGDPDRMRAVFAGFCPAARDLLARVGAAGVWGLHLHPVAPVWQHGPVALLGDAAHPTLPFLAQGANLALEDAWCLADALTAGDVPAALARYEAVRRPRARRAIAAAAANARAYHLGGPARRLAHFGLSIAGRIAPAAMIGRYDWLYRHDVTAPGIRAPR